ncbi:MAG: helix-turn-helix domain-containing protein [Propionicimonas sp.]
MVAVRERARRPGLGPTRAEVLAELRNSGTALPATTIAELVGLHPNSARFHLDALTEQGLAERNIEARDRPGRPRTLYRATPHPPAEADALQGVARALVRHLGRLDHGPGEQAEAAGRMWGEELAATMPETPPIERVMDTLTTLGYQPQQTESEDTIALTMCPLRSLLDEMGPGTTPAVCLLHLGLMRGLVADDPDFTVTDLEPMVAPSTCLARIQRTSTT